MIHGNCRHGEEEGRRQAIRGATATTFLSMLDESRVNKCELDREEMQMPVYMVFDAFLLKVTRLKTLERFLIVIESCSMDRPR